MGRDVEGFSDVVLWIHFQEECFRESVNDNGKSVDHIGKDVDDIGKNVEDMENNFDDIGKSVEVFLDVFL